MKEWNELEDPAAKKTYDICYAGFRSILDTVDRDDPAGIASRAGNAALFAPDKLLGAFFGLFLVQLKMGGLTLRNAGNLNHMLRYLERGVDKPIGPLHETYLKLLLWGNFIEIPAPLILLANCLQTPRAARFEFEFFDKQKRKLHTGHAKLGFVLDQAEHAKTKRPSLTSPDVKAMLSELESVFVFRLVPSSKPGKAPYAEGWLRNAIAHCSYLVDLGARRVYDNKHLNAKGNPDPSYCLSFDHVWELYQRAFGYLEGFRKAVEDFCFESSGTSFPRPNWGRKY